MATSSEQLAVDFELYLPESWTEGADRRREARIPNDVRFKTKIELALDMIKRAKQDEIPGNIILADGGYGDSTEFRNTLRQLGFDFAVGILPTLGVVRLDRDSRINTKPQSAAEVVTSLPSTRFAR